MRQLGHFEIIATLNRGTPQHRACDTRSGNEVFLEQLPVPSDSECARRYVETCRAVSQVDSPHVVRMLDAGIGESGLPYSAWELLAGISVRGLMRAMRNRPLAELEATWIARRALRGLEALHARGILHEAPSPGALFLCADGGLKVIGAGAEAVMRAYPGGLLRGKRCYVSPEWIRGEPLDVRHDLFIFGLTLVELLTGARALEGESEATIFESCTSLAPPDASSGALSGAIRGALELDRSKRFASAAQFEAALPTAEATAEQMHALVESAIDARTRPALRS